MSLSKRNSEVGGMLSVPRSRAPAPVVNIYNNGGDGKDGKGGKANAGGGTVIPAAGKPGVGTTYDPKAPLPQISNKDSQPQALDKLTTGMGQIRDIKGRPGKEADQKQAGLMQGLAKGRGAGEGKQKKANESAIASLLSFGKLPKGKNKKSSSGKILSGAS